MEILLIRAIVFAVSLSGCFWHLIDVSRIYHSGETNVLVNFERDVMVPLPAVTICIDASLNAIYLFQTSSLIFFHLLPCL